MARRQLRKEAEGPGLPQALVELGRVAGSYGVRGWIRAEAAGEALAACPSWRIAGAEYAVTQTRMHSGTLLAKLVGVETREQALKLKGALIEVPRAALPRLSGGHYYYADLIGLEVVNEAGERLGTVKQLTSGGAHDVMLVQGERTRLLPWVSAVVKEVDLRGGRVRVAWGADW